MTFQRQKAHITACFFIISCFNFGSLAAQMPSAANTYGPPLEIPLVLSGNFGELRSNHFHSGLDIKTNLAIGIPVYATADGYVSRIKVAHFGYGKALYLTHNDGYSTVYAHLDRFEENIQGYVKQQQYKKESFEVELFPGQEVFVIKAGQLIGYTGNTGSSGGPHLHYEIRDSESRPINPLQSQGIQIKDSRAPVVSGLRYYPLDLVKNSVEAVGVDLSVRKTNDSTYIADLIHASGTIGLGAELYDQQDAANNKNGVYHIEGFLNGSKHYEVYFDRISFDETRFMNRYMDYRYYSNSKKRVQKLFRENNNPIGIIKDPDHRGMLTIAPGQAYTYELLISDFHGNTTTILIPITGDTLVEKGPALQQTLDLGGVNESSSQLDVYGSETHHWSEGRYAVMIPRETFYDPTQLSVSVRGDTLFLDKDQYPMQNKIEITYNAQWMSSDDFQSAYIGRISPYGKAQYQNTNKENMDLKTRVGTLGRYGVFYDRTAPLIKAKTVRQGQWISSLSELTLIIEDKESGISSYRATLNGQFILMEYDYKTKQLVYDFADAIVTDTQQNLALVVLDNVGNSATFELMFYRKND